MRLPSIAHSKQKSPRKLRGAHAEIRKSTSLIEANPLETPIHIVNPKFHVMNSNVTLVHHFD
jgi:hypothetical protein